jgi:hypothetical protein
MTIKARRQAEKDLPRQSPTDLETAYLAHTLAGLLLGQLSTRYPWLAAGAPVVPVQAPPWLPVR